MTCSEFMDMLDNYELLTDSQREELKIHTSECEACRKEFEFFQSIISITSQIKSVKKKINRCRSIGLNMFRKLFYSRTVIISLFIKCVELVFLFGEGTHSATIVGCNDEALALLLQFEGKVNPFFIIDRFILEFFCKNGMFSFQQLCHSCVAD